MLLHLNNCKLANHKDSVQGLTKYNICHKFISWLENRYTEAQHSPSWVSCNLHLLDSCLYQNFAIKSECTLSGPFQSQRYWHKWSLIEIYLSAPLAAQAIFRRHIECLCLSFLQPLDMKLNGGKFIVSSLWGNEHSWSYVTSNSHQDSIKMTQVTL